MRQSLTAARVLVSLALLGLASSGWGLAQAPPDALARIEELSCRKSEGFVTGSFRLEGALAPEDRSTLEGGITVSFLHRLTVVRRRALFFDKLLARKTIEVSATLDTLTKEYTLRRLIDGIPVASRRTEDDEEVTRWLTEVRGQEISLPEGEARGSLELRVKSEYRRIYAVWLLPWSLSAIDSVECR